MARPVRRSLRLVSLAVAAACLCAPATARAEPPTNDTPTGALAIDPEWTGFLAEPASTIAGGGMGVGDWTNASVNDAEDPTPTCLGDQGFRSLWYKVKVPEPAVLQVTVESKGVDRFQPVVTIHAPDAREELGCGLGGTNSTTRPLAVASAYTHSGDYLIRVAQAGNYAPLAGGPQVVISVLARDVAPPKITIKAPGKIDVPGVLATYSAEVEDGGAGVAPSTAKWTFCDPACNRYGEAAAAAPADTRVREYAWKKNGAGLRKVIFEVKDLAGNYATYSWVVYVRDPDPPRVRFSTTLPIPGNRRVRIAIRHNEIVGVKLLVQQQQASGKPKVLFNQLLSMYHPGTTRRTLLLRPFVGTGSVVISGVARDRAGNATLLPTCVIDPVRGTGACDANAP